MSPARSVGRMARGLVLVALTLACHAAAVGASAREAQSARRGHTGGSTEASRTALASSGGVVTVLDLPYPPPPGGDSAKARLDINYVPDGQPKRWMVFVHGGSWVSGDKSHLQSAPDMVPWFVARNYVVAAVNFRLASPPDGPLTIDFADQATDIAYALAWLDTLAATYGVTEPAPLLFGYSSGAHLVALLAADVRYLQSAGLPANHLYAAISFDVHAYDVPYALQLMPGSEIAHNIPLIEHLFGTAPAEQLAGSPSNFVEPGNVVPSLLVSADPSAVVGSKGYIASETGRRHWELLRTIGVRAYWSHFDQETHPSLVRDFGTTGDAPTEAVRTFLDALTATTSFEPPLAPSLTLSAAPNPASGGTWLRFSLAHASSMRLDVYDVAGRRVRALLDAAGGAGVHTVAWDARDDSGRRLASGAYVVRLALSGRVAATTTVVLGR